VGYDDAELRRPVANLKRMLVRPSPDGARKFAGPTDDVE